MVVDSQSLALNSQYDLFDHHPNEIAIDIIYNINPPDEEFGDYSLIRQEIDIINAKNIVPGFGVQFAYAQSYSSMIRYLFPDPVTIAGWKAYVDGEERKIFPVDHAFWGIEVFINDHEILFSYEPNYKHGLLTFR